MVRRGQLPIRSFHRWPHHHSQHGFCRGDHAPTPVTFKAARFDRRPPAAARRFAVLSAFDRPAVPAGPEDHTKPRNGVRTSRPRKGHIMSKKPTLIAYTIKERGDARRPSGRVSGLPAPTAAEPASRCNSTACHSTAVSFLQSRTTRSGLFVSIPVCKSVVPSHAGASPQLGSSAASRPSCGAPPGAASPLGACTPFGARSMSRRAFTITARPFLSPFPLRGQGHPRCRFHFG